MMTTLQLMSSYGSFLASVLGLAVGLIFMLCLLLFVAWTLHTFRVYQKYRHLPGPKVAHFYSGHVRIVADALGTGKLVFGDLVLQWCREHGPIYILFFYSKTMVIVCSPEGVKELVLSSKHPKDRATYEGLQKILGEPYMGTGLVSERHHSTWAARRAIVDPAFHRKYLKQSMTQFNKSSDVMIKRLMNKADGVTEVTMLDELNKVSLDVIAKVSFSCELGIMGDELSPFTNAARVTLATQSTVSTSPWLKYSPLKVDRDRRRQVRECCKLLRGFGEKFIKERLAEIQRGEEVPADSLSYIINATGQLTNEYYGLQNMVDDFVTFFVAGQETTANLLASCLLQLIQQPEILYRLRNEVESVIGDKTSVAFEDLPKLEYLTAVLKESLRLFPPAGGSVRQTAAETYINGQRIPAETTCLVSIYAIGRMEENYQDPSRFDPDRFMHQDPDDFVKFSYIPFSVGPRTCIGKNFAMIETKVILCKLLATFDFSLVPGQSLDMVTRGTLQPKDGCKVTLSARIN